MGNAQGRKAKPPEHVYISDEPITVGKMMDVDKYKFFTALCVALEDPRDQRGLNFQALRAQEFIMQRRELSVKQHWGLLVKPGCAVCELRQAILRANVPKDARLTFDRDQFRALMARIESEAHL